MTSETRKSCEESVKIFSKYINSNLIFGKMLYVGIAGDPHGGEYSPLFTNFEISTIDINKKYNPDIVMDITKTPFKKEYDVIIMVQTIEHIPNIFDLPKELHKILKDDGYLIIDCPWMYHYHAEDSFGDYWRISKDGFKYLFMKYFKILNIRSDNNNTSVLMRKI
jgi:SAM-dependent methyltransferase